MTENTVKSSPERFGSDSLDKIVQKLKETSDPKRRYEYVLWLGKKLPTLSQEFHSDTNKVKGCVSEVHVIGELHEGLLQWKGYSDALITRGLLALLIQGLNGLTPKEVIEINPDFIKATGLHGSLTQSRANGFLNILLMMQKQALDMHKSLSPQ